MIKLSLYLQKKHMKSFKFLFFACTLTAFVSCSKSGSKAPSGGSNDETSVNQSVQYCMKYSPPKDVSKENITGVDTLSRKIIKEGTITFETRDIKKSRQQIKTYVQQLNAYISKETENVYDNKVENGMIIRVPAGNFDKLVQMIGADVTAFKSKNIDVMDVTEEYVDISTRLNTKKEVEKTYIGLLKQAKKMEDVLAIQSQIGSIREEIEVTEGKFRYMNDRIAYSTLNLTYYQESEQKPVFSGKFANAFKNGWQNLVWFFVGIAYIWPFIIILISFIFFIIFIARRSQKKKAKS